MHSCIEQYLEILQPKQSTASTLKVVRHDLTHLITWWESQWRPTFDPALLWHEDLQDWRAFRQHYDGAAPTTINRGLASLRGYFRWATSCHLLSENLTIDVEDVPTEPLAPLSIPAEVIDALLRAAHTVQKTTICVREDCYGTY